MRFASPASSAQGGEFAFVLYANAAANRHLRRRDHRAPQRHRHHLDGADAAGADAPVAGSCRPRSPWKASNSRTGSPARRWSSVSAASARWRARRCSPEASMCDHRYRHRDDPGCGATSASRSTTAMARGSTCCAPPAPAGRRRSPSASTSQTTADKIVEIVKAEFPVAKLLVRSFDRGHSLRLIGAGVDYQIRETFESAMASARRRSSRSGSPRGEAAETFADVRRRDARRLDLQHAAGDFKAGRDLLRGNVIRPAPLTPVAGERQPLGDGRSTAASCTRGLRRCGRPRRTTAAGCARTASTGRRGRDCR